MSKLFCPHDTMRDLTLTNRIVVSPMCQYSAELPPTCMHIGSMALSGAGMLRIEAGTVDAPPPYWGGPPHEHEASLRGPEWSFRRPRGT
jgi:2,4-dienoyl-CoA reductase-like NADH-dependent reductase (Old Yellow Enzyme family)